MIGSDDEMDFKFNKGNLNFRVYSATEVPETGSENDIVIITDVTMSNWILSPDKPTGTPRAEGDVWIQYSVTGNTFDALKQNSMMIAAISATQYIGGAWVDKTAKSYQGGKWVAWYNGELYDAGNEYTSITGGWKAVKGVSGSSYATITKGNNGITISHSSQGSFVEGGIVTSNKIDLTKHSTLKANISALSGAGVLLGLTSVADNFDSTTLIGYAQVSAVGTIKLNVETPGEYYVVLLAAQTQSTFTVTKVWME